MQQQNHQVVLTRPLSGVPCADDFRVQAVPVPEPGPGQLLIRHTLAHAAEAGCKSYEFMGVMADWTRLWTKQTRHYVQVHAMPYSLATVAAATRSMARHARDRMRALTRRGMP